MLSSILSRTAIVLVLAATPLSAETQLIQAGFVDEVGGAERINLSGKLRMLSQRIPAAACNEAAGVAVERAAEVLSASVAEFDKIITGLEYGDESLGMIGAETDRRVLEDLQKMHAIWDPLHVAMDAMIAGDITVENANQIADKEAALLDIAKHTVAMIRDEYADPTALVAADAIVIDIAGRQRMLAQRISKNVCLIASGYNADAATAELAATIEMYEVSLQALRFGMAAAGISAPPSQEIRDGLDEIAADWEALKPTVTAVMEGQQVSIDARAEVFVGALSLTGKMNVLVGKYAEASKLGL